MHLSTDFGGICQLLEPQQASALSNANKVVCVLRFIMIEYQWDAKSQGL